jgi:serine/threonine protein kinase, bacterial
VDAVEFGRYQLLGLISEGAMGRVFRARDTATGQDVALKMLATELINQPLYREQFFSETQAAAQLTEPHIIPIFDSGEIDGRLYLVMPIIDGINLARLLERDGPMPPLRAVRVIEQLASALDAAHAQGLVHHDVKPSNALITETAGREFVYLIDFCIAHHITDAMLTRTDSVLSTLAYMAPEHFTHGAAGVPADIYSLACVLHECLTGAPPFAGDNMEQQITGHLTLDPPRPSEHRSGIPAAFDDVVARGMAKTPDDRYQIAGDLAAAAEHALAGHVPAPTHQPALVGDGDLPAEPASTDIAEVPPAAAPQSRRNRRTLAIIAIAGAVVVLLAILAVVGYLAFGTFGLFGHTSSSKAAPNGSSQPSTPGHPGQIVLPFTLGDPDGVAVDSAGSVYVADSGNNRVMKLAAGSQDPTVLPFTGLNRPAGLAVDGNRALYVSDQHNNRVLKLPAGADTPTELPFPGLSEPHDVAVDNGGNVYVVDQKNNRVLKLPAGADSPAELPFAGLNRPYGVAVDDAGNIYVTDGGNNRVAKLAAGASTPVYLPFTDLNFPDGVAVDRNGNVFVSDLNNNRVLKLTTGSNTPSTVPFTDLFFPYGVAVDNDDNVYVADFHNHVLKMPAR